MVNDTSGFATEGVTRTLNGQIPLRYQTGTTPDWWNPPDGPIRATEVMEWYSDYDSGYGTATYSFYEDAEGVLWIYDYIARHDVGTRKATERRQAD